LEEQCNKQQCGPGEVVMEGLTQLCADGSRHQVTNTKKKSKDKDKKRRRSDEGDDTPRPPTASRSSRTSPILLEDDKPPPPKKRKNEPIGPVPVLKVHPSEFPVELLGLVDADPSDPDDFTKIFTPGGAFDAEDSSSPGFPIVAKAVSKYQDIIEVQIERSFLMNCDNLRRQHQRGSATVVGMTAKSFPRMKYLNLLLLMKRSNRHILTSPNLPTSHFVVFCSVKFWIFSRN